MLVSVGNESSLPQILLAENRNAPRLVISSILLSRPPTTVPRTALSYAEKVCSAVGSALCQAYWFGKQAWNWRMRFRPHM